MEHCTTRFFETCDLDNDKYIALEEWAGCFGIKERECLGLRMERSVLEGWDVVPSPLVAHFPLLLPLPLPPFSSRPAPLLFSSGRALF